MMMRSAVVLASLSLKIALTAFAVTAQAAPDKTILEASNREQSDLVETLKRLVMIESGSGDAAGLAAMAEFLEPRLRALGFKTRRIKSPADVRADIVVGTLTGTGHQKLMLMAHMDTVYQTGILRTQPYKIEGNRMYGPGIADDKGGIAVILHALKILADAGWTDYATLTVLFNPDEETGSRGSGDVISELAHQADTVLSFEPTGTSSTGAWLLLGTAAYASVRMEVKGRASHAGNTPQDGRNALIELAHQLLQTRDVANDIPGAQLNWTNAVSDKAFNQIPDLAVAIADARITKPGAERTLQAALQAKVESAKLVPDTQTSVTVTIIRPGFRANDAGYAVANLAKRIYAEVHGGPFWIVPMAKGATDAGYASRSGKAAVVECFGLPGAGYHAKDEYIQIDAIPRHLYLMARLLMELGKQ
jgi:glutamate carboxypeptidase